MSTYNNVEPYSTSVVHMSIISENSSWPNNGQDLNQGFSRAELQHAIIMQSKYLNKCLFSTKYYMDVTQLNMS